MKMCHNWVSQNTEGPVRSVCSGWVFPQDRIVQVVVSEVKSSHCKWILAIFSLEECWRAKHIWKGEDWTCKADNKTIHLEKTEGWGNVLSLK